MNPAVVILSSIDSVPGRRMAALLGLVQGSTVRTKHLGRDIAASFKNMVGGELRGYTELLQDARAEATARMVAEAESLGADAVVKVRFSTSSIAGGAAELFAYGTAVTLE